MDARAEWETIRRCRGGSTAAFEPLVRLHEKPALAVASALLGDEDDAADAVQEAFVRAYRALGSLKEGSAFGPWFRGILRNLCLDRLRSPHARRESWTSETMDQRVWSEPSGSARLEQVELAEVVQAALATLSPEHRQVLVLKEMEGLGYAEIAQALGIASGTVASRLYNARAALKKTLLARGITLEDVSQ